MSASGKEQELYSPVPQDPPPPYRELDRASTAGQSSSPRMAAAEYYNPQPMAASMAPNSPQPQAMQSGGYPPPQQQQYPHPPPPNTQQYPTSQPHAGAPYPPPPNQSHPPQQYHYPPPPPGHQQAPYSNSSTAANGWNPVFGPHPHAKPYPTPLNSKPFGGIQRLPSDPSQPRPNGNGTYVQAPAPGPAPAPYTAPLQQSYNAGPSGAGKLAPPQPSHPMRRYSDPPRRDQRYNEKHGRSKYDDDYYDSYESDRSRDGRDRRGKKKDHSGRNTFLGAGGGALIGDMIFPGLGTVGGLLLGGYAGHEASRKDHHGRNRSERRDDRRDDRRDYRDQRRDRRN